MTAHKMNGPGTQADADPGAFAAGAEIYRRLEHRPRRPKWRLAAIFGVVAIAAAGGVIAYQTTLGPDATRPAVASQPVAGDHGAQISR